jgi:hypothetical protein
MPATDDEFHVSGAVAASARIALELHAGTNPFDPSNPDASCRTLGMDARYDDEIRRIRSSSGERMNSRHHSIQPDMQNGKTLM